MTEGTDKSECRRFSSAVLLAPVVGFLPLCAVWVISEYWLGIADGHDDPEAIFGVALAIALFSTSFGVPFYIVFGAPVFVVFIHLGAKNPFLFALAGYLANVARFVVMAPSFDVLYLANRLTIFSFDDVAALTWGFFFGIVYFWGDR